MSIENNFENSRDYDNDFNFKEYCIIMNFIQQGYNPINSTTSFSNEIKELYEQNKDTININEYFNLGINLFERNLREFLIYKKELSNMDTIKKD